MPPMMKRTRMTSPQPRSSWLAAIDRATQEQGAALPPSTDQGMGSILWRSADGARFASLKRRLVAASEAAKAGVEWTLWSDEGEGPLVVALFREGLNPTE